MIKIHFAPKKRKKQFFNIVQNVVFDIKNIFDDLFFHFSFRDFNDFFNFKNHVHVVLNEIDDENDSFSKQKSISNFLNNLIQRNAIFFLINFDFDFNFDVDENERHSIIRL